MRTASVRHHHAFQYLVAVSRSGSLRLTNWCLNKCRMMPEGSYDQTIRCNCSEQISGLSGGVALSRSRIEVAIVDSRPFGGTRALRECDPEKVLVEAAEAVDWTRRMKGKGINAEKLQIDWPELMCFKRSFTEAVPKRREDGFAKAGIAAFHGRARFAGPITLQVGEETLEGRHCAGSITLKDGTPNRLNRPTRIERPLVSITCFRIELNRQQTVL
jgi:hypothetical protein